MMAIEKRLLFHYNKILYWSGKDTTGSYDSLNKENEKFKKTLLHYTSTVLATLTYPFDSLTAPNHGIFVTDNINITTSADKNLRIYSWDTWEGGTMHDFDNIVQYKVGNKVYSKVLFRAAEEGDPGCFYSTVYTSALDNKVYYLALFIAVLDSKDISHGIRLFTIENNQLNDTVKLIQTSSGLKNAIGFELTYSSMVLNPKILYDAENKIIKVPAVLEDGTVSDKFIQYKFTGKYFEEVK